MSDALAKALNTATCSYVQCKAAVQQAAEEIFATTRGGVPVERMSFAQAGEQLRHFNGWVFACVHAIASRIAGQAVHVGVQRPWSAKGPGGVKELPAHPLLDLLNDPNDLQIAWSLFYFTVASLELTGRCLWWVTEVDRRQQILPVPTSWITGMKGTTSFESFTIRPTGHVDEYEVDADEAVYFYYPSPTGPRDAASPLQAAAYAVSTDVQIQASQLAMFERGIHPSHAIIVGKTAGPDGSMNTGSRPRLSGEQRRQLIRAIQKIYSGAVKNGEPLILDGLIEDVKRLSATSAEMDWLNSGAVSKARICQIFGVNPIILGEIESANRASSLAAEEHLASTLNPKIKLIGDTIGEWHLPRYPTNGQKLVVWLDPYTPHDAEMELRRWQLGISAGAVTLDEIREELLGLPPMPGGLGSDLAGAALIGVEQAINRQVAMTAMIEYDALKGPSQEARDLAAAKRAAKSNGHVHAGV
jgi:HK97 family phage portal protein